MVDGMSLAPTLKRRRLEFAVGRFRRARHGC